MAENVPLTPHHTSLFLRLLESTSVHSLLPMLDARSRWLLIIEILLGNAPVRGGRTRDYPFSADRADSTQIAHQLLSSESSFKPGKADVAGVFTVYDMIVALQCIGIARPIESARSEQHFTMAMRVLIEMLFPAESHRIILDSMGISAKGEDGAIKQCQTYRRREVAMARRLAVLARTQVPESAADASMSFLRDRFELRERDITELSGTSLSLIYLRTKEAQSFIDRCHSPFIQRGASFWCSQTSARAREMLTSGGFGARGVFLDNDSVTVISSSSGEEVRVLEVSLRKTWFDSNDSLQVSKSFIQKNYPRLLPYYVAACKEGISTAMAMPSFGLQVRSKSLLDLATDIVLFEGVTDSPRSDDSVVISRPVEEPCTAELSCSGRWGDKRISSVEHSIPSWYNPRIGEGYGFPAIAFSLAELTYAKSGGRAISHQLKERGCPDLTTVSTQFELLEGTNAPDRRISYLKYDGDGFGPRFSAIPSLLRPGLSIALEMLMRDTWLSAVASLARRHDFKVVPADLVYFGGDDMLIALPQYLLKEFLQDFDVALASHPQSSSPMTFTFSSVTFELPPVNYGNREPEFNPHTATIGKVNALLKEAKEFRKYAKQRVNPGSDEKCSWTALQRTQGFCIEPVFSVNGTDNALINLS
jgi:hypothetical protein